MNLDIIKWWSNLDPLTEEEYKRINATRNDGIKNEDDTKFEFVETEFFKRMPNCHCTIQSKQLQFNISATAFIDQLFETYVDDNTLVITAECNHPNVVKNLDKCKNVIKLNQYFDIAALNLKKVSNKLSNFDKVFVYIIGTTNDSGEITPQEFFVKLKTLLTSKRKENIIVIDDVQGMFMVPRNYELFDYVIGTAHCTVRRYDMGILISNRKDIHKFGFKYYNWGEEFLLGLDVILCRSYKESIFNIILKEFFSEFITNNSIDYELTVPYIFRLKTTLPDEIYEFLENNGFPSSISTKREVIIVSPKNSQVPHMHLRAHVYIQNPHLLETNVKLMYLLLTNIPAAVDYVKDLNENEKADTI